MLGADGVRRKGWWSHSDRDDSCTRPALRLCSDIHGCSVRTSVALTMAVPTFDKLVVELKSLTSCVCVGLSWDLAAAGPNLTYPIAVPTANSPHWTLRQHAPQEDPCAVNLVRGQRPGTPTSELE